MVNVILGLLSALVPAADDKAKPALPSPEARAVAYLAREVPRWSPENKCFSCHNNGDGARALYLATRLGVSVPESALADTTAWLRRPQGWDKNGGDGPYSDKKLARLHFAAALAAAVEAGLVKDRDALLQAAELIVPHQEKDGSWQVEAEGSIGSPVTRGAALATHLARRTLHTADPARYREALGRADHWLRNTKVSTVLDAAAVLLALDGADSAAQGRHCLDLIRKGLSKDGGWGPFVTAPPETFDTAVVLLALSRHRSEPDVPAMIRAGRAYLIARQQEDGSWEETTRPPGSESYAQRQSTTAWAAQALLTTRAAGVPPGKRTP